MQGTPGAQEAASKQRQVRAESEAVDAKIARMEAEEERRGAQRPTVQPKSTVSTSGTHNFPRKPRSAPAKPSLWNRFMSAVKKVTAPIVNAVQKPATPSAKPKPWWEQAKEWVQQKIVQPMQNFAARWSEPPNPSGPLYPKLHTATTLLQAGGYLLDRTLFNGRLTQAALGWRERANHFVESRPALQTALNVTRNLADFGMGFASQVADDFSFGLYGRLTGIAWSNGSDAFQNGRTAGRVVSNVWGQVEMAAGLALAAASVKFIPPTAGGAAACAALTGGGCLVLGGAALAVETAGVLVGTGLVAHGGAMLMRNAGNPVGKAADPTLGYGSNTGDTGYNARILRRNMENAGVQAPPKYEPHHIVPSTSQNEWAVLARERLWKFGIDINAAENGVFVPKSVNGHLNNREYMKAVYEALKQAETQEDAIRILQKIAEQVRLTGNYP